MVALPSDVDCGRGSESGRFQYEGACKALCAGSQEKVTNVVG